MRNENINEEANTFHVTFIFINPQVLNVMCNK